MAKNVLAISLAAVIAISGSYIAWKLAASLFIIVAAAFKYILLAGVLLVLVLFPFSHVLTAAFQLLVVTSLLLSTNFMHFMVLSARERLRKMLKNDA